MTVIEFARAFLERAPVGVVITDARVQLPGPTIVYANAAFGTLTGRSLQEIIGLTPRFMQGRETRRLLLDKFAQALVAGERYHGYLTNYRASGEKYLVEIDCRPLRNEQGEVAYFLAFEREVTRRIGRPASGASGRYDPVIVSNDQLGSEFTALNVFSTAKSVVS